MAPPNPRHIETKPPGPPPISPDIFAQTPAAGRVPSSDPTKPNRHILRPLEDYTEYEEELSLRIPENEWPQDFALQWVTQSVYGQPFLQHRARYERAGWVSVMVGEFDGKFDHHMPGGHEGEITNEGLVLMARSKAWNIKAKQNNIMRARQRVMIKEQQLRMGDLSGVTLAPDHPTAIRSNVVDRSLDTIAMPVPQK
jgi:hypothetical protein